jgi:hypothetical protein
MNLATISTTTATTSTTTSGGKFRIVSKWIHMKISFILILYVVHITNTYNENDPVNITCTNSMRITVVYGFYGVSTCVSCSCGYCICASMTVTSTVAATCTNFIMCAFSAGDAFFGDPCSSYAKTFTITFYCS